MIIQHNMPAFHAMTQLGINNTNLKKSAERLSSGYRINRAADDAATLSISEKKRSQIRGLRRAVQNAEDGIGFVQTGDGAMGQMEELLQRMRVLTVQALNDGVYEPEDQAAIQMEFDELQSEIDRINNETEFNKKPVFEHYSDTFYLFEGNRHWKQDQPHKIDTANQSLTVKYKTGENEPEKQITLTIPEGTYTTQQLIDEMDDYVTALGDGADGLYLEYTDRNTCNMVLQDGAQISEVSGGLSYLFFDEYKGSQVGSLIGTTVFDPDFALEVNNKNNELKFTIEYFDGTTKDVSLLIDEGYYTRSDMINYLNNKLAGTGMTASEYGDYSIQLGGEDGIITGLKGNMFKIDDEGEVVMISVFYDNTKYGSVKKTSAEFTGGAVLVSTPSDTECNRFSITDKNNTLRLRVGNDETAPYEEIVLDSNQSYSMADMVRELQEKLNNKQIPVTVSAYGPISSDSKTPNGNEYSFSGIKLTSKDTGADLKIEFDIPGSTAYDTLFVKRTYTDAGKVTQTTSGRDTYTSPTLTGGRIYGTDNIPMTVVKDKNDTFVLQTEETVNGQKTNGTYTVTLTSGKTYQTMNEILAEINQQLNSPNAPMGIKGKIQAVDYAGAIQFKAADDNRTVTSIRFGDTASAGYQNLFVGKTTVYSTEVVSSSGYPPKVSLDLLSDPVVVDNTNDVMSVNVGGENRVIHIPHGSYRPEDLADKLTELLKGKESTSTRTFVGAGAGNTESTTRTHSGQGRDYPPTIIQCSAKGTGGAQDGTTTVVGGTAATYTVPAALRNPMRIDGSNNQFGITVNGTRYDIILDNGDHNPSALAKQFQDKLNDAIDTTANKVTVSLDSSNRLVFTTNIKGSGMSMSFGTDTSTFMSNISKNQSPATMTTKSMQSSIKVDNNSNLYSMEVNGNTHTVTLDNGTYTPSGFASMLGRKLQENGAGVTVTASGNALYFTTDAKGDGASLNLNTGSCGSAASAMFGEQISRTPASATMSSSLAASSSTAIKQKEEGTFSVTLSNGGSTEQIDINIPSKEGGYSNSEMRNLLNNTLQPKGVNVSVDYYGTLTFTSTARGSGVSLSVNGSVDTTSKTPDVKASINPDTGKLELTNTSSGAAVSMKPVSGSAVLKPIPIPTTYPPNRAPTDGSVNQAYYTLKTNNNLKIPSPTTIADYNKDFTFTYVTPAGTKNVSLSMDEGTYSREKLAELLEKKLRDELGDGEIKVTADDTGLKLTAGHYGSNYYLSNLSGGFHEYVLEGKAVRGSDEKTVNNPSKQIVKDTYIAGRKDVRNNISSIQKDINDVLSMDVTINNTVHSFEFTLTPGDYTADELVAELQKKLDAKLAAAGLPELPPRSILAGVGTFETGVAGADDKNALFFYVNPDMELEEGDYRIDGLGGTALFEIFYKTEGSLVPAYLTGTKDLTSGVEILPGENEFSMDVDGITYNYTIPEGKYSSEEFLEQMNQILKNPDASVTASFSGNALKFSYKKMGEHEITNVQGPAKSAMFYEMYGRQGNDSEEWLQIGANAGQGTTLQRFSMSTMSMGINSITLMGQKYANKALDRLDGALNYLNTKRSLYGAKQNRLEYTIKGNNITAENTQASESRDRDTDMASEMVQYAKAQILGQAGTSILTQANQHTQTVLKLLNN